MGKVNWIFQLKNEKEENLPFIGGFSLYKKMNYLLPPVWETFIP